MMKLITVERFNIASSKPFEDVIRGLEKGIGRPDMGALQKAMGGAPTFEEYERVIHAAVGAADLLEFLRLDLGAAIAKGPGAKGGRQDDPDHRRKSADHAADGDACARCGGLMLR